MTERLTAQLKGIPIEELTTTGLLSSIKLKYIIITIVIFFLFFSFKKKD